MWAMSRILLRSVEIGSHCQSADTASDSGYSLRPEFRAKNNSKALGGAAPRLFRPVYAWANMGHPSREEGLVLCSQHGATQLDFRPERHRLSSLGKWIRERLPDPANLDSSLPVWKITCESLRRARRFDRGCGSESARAPWLMKSLDRS